MERKLRSINFFRTKAMCTIGVRSNGRGVVFTIVRKKENEQQFRNGQRWRAVLSLDEVGAVLLLSNKSGDNVSFYHNFAKASGRQGKGGGRRIQFKRTEKGDTEFGIYDKERGEGATFTFSPAEWVVVRHYLGEALRWCFYSPPLQSDTNNNDVNDVGDIQVDGGEQGSEIVDDAPDVPEEEAAAGEDIFDLV